MNAPLQHQTQTQSWACLFTEPNKELEAAQSSKFAGLEVYLPLYSKQISHARKKQWVKRPFFPRYLFVRPASSKVSVQIAKRLRGVTSIVGGSAHPHTVPHSIISFLQKRMTD